MKTWDLLRVLDRCELKAGFHVLTGWQLRAKGALPIILLAVTMLVLWVKPF